MELILVVLPAFLIFGTGYIGQKIFNLDVKSISTMSLYLMIPFLTFDTFYTNELSIEYLYIFLFNLILVAILIAITIVVGKMIKIDKSLISAMLLGTVFPNSGNYGAPVALFAFGAAAFDYAVVIMVIHGLFINSVGIFIASYGSEKSTTIKEALKNVIKMPILYGVFLGILFQLLHIELPSTIVDGIGLLGSAAIPTVMLILGMQLAQIKPQKFDLKIINMVTVIRMVISPLFALLIVSFMPLNDTLKNVIILLAAMPIAANTTILAIRFDTRSNLVSFMTLVTTLTSLVTIPIILHLLG